MIKGAPLTAIIPVRGGSKGIPGKNLREVGGISLLERAIRFAGNSPRITRTIVSTDDPAMFAMASSFNVASPTLRPAELANDTATTADVVSHLLGQCGIDDGYLLILQATSPFRVLVDLENLCAAYEAGHADAIVSVAALDEPRPEKLQRIVDGNLCPYLDVGFEGPRQALPQAYRLNGAFYLISVSAFLRTRKFLPASTMPFIMPEIRSHNLDSETDWHVMEAMIAAGFWELEKLP